MARGRKAGDGRGRLGGRAEGVPNKDTYSKARLRSISINYLIPDIEEVDEDGKKTGRLICQFEKDLSLLDPHARVQAQISILQYHTARMQATAVDLSTTEQNKTLSERLSALSRGEEIPSGTED